MYSEKGANKKGQSLNTFSKSILLTPKLIIQNVLGQDLDTEMRDIRVRRFSRGPYVTKQMKKNFYKQLNKDFSLNLSKKDDTVELIEEHFERYLPDCQKRQCHFSTLGMENNFKNKRISYSNYKYKDKRQSYTRFFRRRLFNLLKSKNIRVIGLASPNRWDLKKSSHILVSKKADKPYKNVKYINDLEANPRIVVGISHAALVPRKTPTWVYYRDRLHLNRLGAKAYSRVLAHAFTKILRNDYAN